MASSLAKTGYHILDLGAFVFWFFTRTLDCQVNKPGRIYVKSPSIMKGYYRNEILSKQVIIDGWLDTGDIGYINELGFLFVLSRSDDMIIKGGMNIYPKEIESAINSLQTVTESLVYGVSSKIGDAIAASVVLNEENKNLDKKMLLHQFSEVLPAFQIPSTLEIVDTLPKNASGKLIRPKRFKI